MSVQISRRSFRYLSSLIVLALFTITQTSFAAEIRTELEERPAMLIFGQQPFLYIEGDIAVGDADRLMQELAKYRVWRGVGLTSSGGSVAEAMKIGRVLRDADLYLTITKDGCFSSCVLIVAGANKRGFIGPVGVHRPHFVEAVGDESIEDAYHKMAAIINAYFSEMNIAGSFAELMFAIPPSETRVLTKSELDRYFPREDPVAEAKRIDREARSYEISPATYRKRFAFATTECKALREDRFQCKEAIMRGVSLQVYKDWEDECWEWIEIERKKVPEVADPYNCQKAVPPPWVK